jgi:hypothetical protein
MALGAMPFAIHDLKPIKVLRVCFPPHPAPRGYQPAVRVWQALAKAAKFQNIDNRSEWPPETMDDPAHHPLSSNCRSDVTATSIPHTINFNRPTM